MNIKLLPKKKMYKVDEFLGVRMEQGLKEELMLFCESNNISMSTLVVALVKDFLGKQSTTIKKEQVS
jgi:hypothetical protein